MDKLTFDGKGQTSSVDHINRIGFDNRKENLRIVSQSDQNKNQKTHVRKMKLPDKSNILINDISKNVWYRKANSKNPHNDGFCVQIRDIDNTDDILWVSTCATTVSLRFKLEHTKKYLRDLKNKHPSIFTNRNIDSDYSSETIELMKSYNEIIKLSKFDCIKDNLITVPTIKDYLKEDLTNLSKDEINLLKDISVSGTNNRSNTTVLPKNCKVTVDMIPKYCYYRKMSKSSGDAFVIDKKHPKTNGKSWCTSRSRSIDLDTKFGQLLKKLKELENN